MESSILLTIVVGAVSGVLSAALLWLIKILFTDHFLPFYQKTVYRGSSIQGKWIAFTYEDDQKKDAIATIEVKQFAHNVTATYTMYFANNEQLVFDCEGEYWETYLSIRGRSVSSKNYNILAALFKQRDNGAILQGDICCRHSAEDRPYTLQGMTFERQL